MKLLVPWVRPLVRSLLARTTELNSRLETVRLRLRDTLVQTLGDTLARVTEDVLQLLLAGPQRPGSDTGSWQARSPGTSPGPDWNAPGDEADVRWTDEQEEAWPEESSTIEVMPVSAPMTSFWWQAGWRWFTWLRDQLERWPVRLTLLLGLLSGQEQRLLTR